VQQHALSGLTSAKVVERRGRDLEAAGMLCGDELAALWMTRRTVRSLTPSAVAASGADRTPDRPPVSGAAAVPSCAAAVSATASVRSVMAPHHRWSGRGVQGPESCNQTIMEDPQSPDPTRDRRARTADRLQTSAARASQAQELVAVAKHSLALARLALQEARAHDAHDPAGDDAAERNEREVDDSGVPRSAGAVTRKPRGGDRRDPR
jgi:hypothetical protein